MNPLVNLQSARLCETFLANVAGEQAFVEMSPRVPLQAAQLTERLSADLTRVRMSCQVDRFVYVQEVCVCERLVVCFEFEVTVVEINLRANIQIGFDCKFFASVQFFNDVFRASVFVNGSCLN